MSNLHLKSLCELDVIPDQAWLMEKRPKFKSYLGHISSEKLRQEHLLNQMYEQSKTLDGWGKLQPVIVANSNDDANNNDIHNNDIGNVDRRVDNLQGNENNQQEEEGVKDELTALDNEEEFPDEAKEPAHEHEGEDLDDVLNEPVLDLEEQMNKEAIGGLDTGEY